ncbi:hypothetical protein [Aneurinibacillus terranovensis]|uniref:hypothetical protein n=1 Tax=Aneurinibacillus terranovensis TaxID=278991 RepID=UPI00042235FC|nr:hypothetical protein [Aneurinibacillus terranovensis]
MAEDPNTRPENAVSAEDQDEGISRMVNDGGGVVNQVKPVGAPVFRNSLVDVEIDEISKRSE